MLIVVYWHLLLVCGASAVAIVVFWAIAPPLRQLVVDTALALGLGSPVSDAGIGGVSCTRQSLGGGRFRMVQTLCDVTVTRNGTRFDLEVQGGGSITSEHVRSLRTLGGSVGAVSICCAKGSSGHPTTGLVRLV